MTEYPLVDPELWPLLEAWPTVELRGDLLDAIRSNGARLPAPPIVANDVRMAERRVPGPAAAPEVALRIYTPAGEGPFPCLYHIHGGGYVLGDAASLEDVHRPMAAALGCVIVSVDYRLAPETVFPGAIEDCYAGLAWTTTHAGELGIDPARIGVTGESAGAGLAAALALLVRDRGEYRLAFQNLIYPMIDDRTCTTTDPHPHTGAFIWTPHNNRFGWRALLGQEPGGPDISPYAAASRATDLTGLPPTYISTGALDLFLEEDLDYARRLIRAGVPTELHVYPGAVHGFERHPSALVSRQSRRDRMDALRRALASSATV